MMSAFGEGEVELDDLVVTLCAPGELLEGVLPGVGTFHHPARGRSKRRRLPSFGNTPQQPAALEFSAGRAFGSLLGSVDGAGPSQLPAAGGLGDAAIHRRVLELQADHAVVSLPDRKSTRLN